MKKIYLLAALGFAVLLNSCSNKVDFGEQYKKIVYIINSKEGVYYARHDAANESKGNISVYVTGSELPEQDIRVSYKVDPEALKKYNEREYGDQSDLYFSLIPENLYSFQTSDVTIKKGEPYGCLEFTLNTLDLLPDKSYILPITIDSAEGAEISENLHTILYAVQIQNEYVGNYISTCFVDGAAKGEINKEAIAVSSKIILLPLANKSNTMITKKPSLTTDYYQIILNDDNSLNIKPYLQSIVHQDMDKENYYDPEERIFYIHYNIEDKYGEYIPIEETLKAI